MSWDFSKLENLSEPQAAVVRAFTEVPCCSYLCFKAYAEEKLERDLTSDDLTNVFILAELKEASREDFAAMLPSGLYVDPEEL